LNRARRMPQGDKKEIGKEATVIFVDWDDTLLCSSYLSGAGYRLDSVMESSSPLERELKDLETSVISLLRLAMSFGDVHVVTNAETGWVQLSAKKFLPGVIPILDRIKVLSARSTYESSFPDSPVKWKFCAFQERLFSDPKSPKNVISFGDSHVEREAVRAVTRGLPNTKTKSVKFAEKPSMEQLRRQLELVVNCFQYIHGHEGDLDLQLTVTVNVRKSDSESTEKPETSKGINASQKVKEEGKQTTPSPLPPGPTRSDMDTS